MTIAEMPRTIRASIHQDALTRVPDFFNASTLQVLNELLQNSRRAGASRVHVTTSGSRISVSDDGRGIDDPSSLLAFGLSGWGENTARSEHPAGMGIYSLARRGTSRISSKTPGGDAWCVELTTEVFLGNRDAEVEDEPDFEGDHGTTVTFARRPDDYHPSSSIAQAARYFPLPVYHTGEPLEQEDFLEEALHVETWQGVRIGIYAQGKNKGMNFHGTVISHPGLPNTNTRFGTWHAEADVADAPGLQLVLPTRHQVVQSEFLEGLKIAAQTATYRAMARHHQPVEVPHDVHRRAAEAGFDLPVPRAMLPCWKANTARGSHTRSDYQPLPADAIIISGSLPTPDQQALQRAAHRAGVAHRLFHAESGMSGFEWYDGLYRMESLRILYTQDGELQDVRNMRRDLEENPPDAVYPQRPQSITLNLKATGRRGSRISMGLPTDVAFINEDQDYMDDNLPMVAHWSDISPEDLAQLLVDAFFLPSDDKESDSYDTQEDYHKQASLSLAYELLTSEEEATMARIESAVRRNLLFLIPAGSTLTVTNTGKGPGQIALAAGAESA